MSFCRCLSQRFPAVLSRRSQWRGYSSSAEGDFKNVLIVRKKTRLELEREECPELSLEEFKELFKRRGSDYAFYLSHHNTHHEFCKRITEAFSKYTPNIRHAQKSTLSKKDVEWSDLVVAAGGDGTFLFTSGHIEDSQKPIVGFNTDPISSEGHLLLPKQLSYNIPKAVEKIYSNDFTWLLRNRIQVELRGACVEGFDITSISDLRFMNSKSPRGKIADINVTSKVIPWLAVNEVFIAESLMSRVTNLVLEVADHKPTKVKCSGLCVTTGTGSTSWNFSINRLSTYHVHKLLTMIGHPLTNLTEITRKFNETLSFPPDDKRIFYTLKDLICTSVSPDPPGLSANSFVHSMKVHSKCSAAHLIIDGGRAYSFSDGSSALLTSRPDLSLRCIAIKD